MSKYRTHSCGELNEQQIGQPTRLAGWINRKRDHGNLLFIDLRDHFGVTQCVIEAGEPFFSVAEGLRAESVVVIEGTIVGRSEQTINPDIPTGSIEVRIGSVDVLSVAAELPMQVFGDQEYPEEIRLKYRFLDLRREKMQRNMLLRSGIVSTIRRSMEGAGFTEFQTPILTASSPEGARDFLVPSRLHPGKFYALPQAPQQFKQLVMAGGFDRYFQIAPCFRDEDPRADRSPGEFYQLDIEMAFVEQKDILSAVEPVISSVFQEHSSWEHSLTPFKQIPYTEAILKYGTDKPDLRIPIEICDLTEIFRDSQFKLFATAIKAGAVVRAIRAPGAADQPRSFFDRMNDWARAEQGAAGLGYIVFAEEALGPIARNLSPEQLESIRSKAKIESGDAIFFACDQVVAAASLAGVVRAKLSEDLDLVEQGKFSFCWITNFPFYEYNEESKNFDFAHNPFSMPQGEIEAFNVDDPLSILSHQYDLVCNGYELGSGAVRNHLPELMIKAFTIAGYDKSEVQKRFGGLYNALQFGVPPHGGIALGLERIIMLIAHEPNLREVILFPMNQRGEDLLMEAPAEVSDEHLKELSIRKIVLPKVSE